MRCYVDFYLLQTDLFEALSKRIMIADHDLVKKSFGPMIVDHDLAKKR
jgi:hypothetical protein